MPARKKITAEIVEQAKRLEAKGVSLREQAERLGVGKSALAEEKRKAAGALPRRSRRVQVPPRARVATPPASAPAAPLPPPPPDPADVDIDAIDTLDVARRLLTDLRTRFALADDVRVASLAEKIIGVIGRIEQIQARRPAPPPAPDALAELYSRNAAGTLEELERHLPDRIDPSEVWP